MRPATHNPSSRSDVLMMLPNSHSAGRSRPGRVELLARIAAISFFRPSARPPVHPSVRPPVVRGAPLAFESPLFLSSHSHFPHRTRIGRRFRADGGRSHSLPPSLPPLPGPKSICPRFAYVAKVTGWWGRTRRRRKGKRCLVVHKGW